MQRWHYSIPLHLSNDLKKYDIINQVKNDTNVCDYKSYSTFFNNICEQIEQEKWVDIENEYYNALNKEYFFNPLKLNNTRVRDKKKQEANMKKIGNLAGILYIYG